jgi:cytochrome c oxidase cbb3-type subunit 3
VVQDLSALKAQRAGMTELLAATPLEDVAKNPELMSFARAQGKAAFGDNCAPCHGAGAGGAKGFPNLNDDEWLWGGKLHEIATTLQHGVRWSLDENTRNSAMPPFGRDNILTSTQISQVADYVRSLSGLSVDKGADLRAGARVFADNCASCHGAKGEGNRELGSPNLTDAIWLYGPDKKTIVDGLWGGRAGAMPAWGGRLDETTLKALTVYVHSLGGGE